MGSKILSGRGLKRKRTSVSSGVKKAKNRKKNQQQIKNGGRVSKKKLEKPNLRRKQIKKGDIMTFSHKT